MTKADDASGSWIIRVDLIGLGWCRSRHQILPEPIQLGQKYVQQKRDNASSSWGLPLSEDMTVVRCCSGNEPLDRKSPGYGLGCRLCASRA